jgi:hypothetical protein
MRSRRGGKSGAAADRVEALIVRMLPPTTNMKRYDPDLWTDEFT